MRDMKRRLVVIVAVVALGVTGASLVLLHSGGTSSLQSPNGYPAPSLRDVEANVNATVCQSQSPNSTGGWSLQLVSMAGVTANCQVIGGQTIVPVTSQCNYQASLVHNLYTFTCTASVPVVQGANYTNPLLSTAPETLSVTFESPTSPGQPTIPHALWYFSLNWPGGFHSDGMFTPWTQIHAS